MSEEILLSDRSRERLARSLVDFSLGTDAISFIRDLSVPHHRVTLAPESYGHEGLLRLILQNVLDFQDFGPFEKTAWEFSFEFKGSRCGIALRKLGMRFYVHADDADAAAAERLAQDVVSRLLGAVRLLEEEVLRPLADRQLAEGNVTLLNQYSRLHGVYSYFRTQQRGRGAESGLGAAGVANGESGGPPNLADLFNAMTQYKQTVFNNTIAAVNAFFSMLEHLLVLLLPAAGFDSDSESLPEFIGARWADKYKRIFPVARDPEAKRHYDGLHWVAEQYRNPYAHGGFDKGQGTLFFHLPGFGVLPARLADFRTRPHAEFTYFGTPSGDIWTIFDELEAWMRTSDMRFGVRFAETGLNIRFDREWIASFKNASVSDEGFDEFVEDLSLAWERAANMDW